MAINTGKVITGGLIAGVVMNVIDYAINNFLLADQFKAALDALNPTLSANAMATNAIVMFVAIDFLMAIVLVWAYAAMRPRFGAGPGTATKTALCFFVFGSLIWAMLCAMGMFTWSFFAMGSVASLVNMVITTNVGAKFYSEA